MKTLVDLTSGLTNASFVALAVTCFVRWRRRSSEPAKWAALTFGVLGAVALAGWVISETGGGDVAWQGKLTLALLVSFPYCLYRFTAAFGPHSARVDRAATYSWALVVVVTLLIPELPRPGGGRPAWFEIYVLAVLAEWTALSLVAATKLWRSGRGQTTVVRRRMRLLTVASVGMSVAVVTAGSARGGSEGLHLGLQLLTLASSLLFLCGLAPPQFLLVSWRRREEVNLDRAVQSLMAATTRDEVTSALLPNVVALLGGRAAALADDKGRILGVDGVIPDDAASARPPGSGDGTGSRDSVEIPLQSGRLVVWVSPYTPFFGNKELERLRSLGSLLDVALERIRLSEALTVAKDEAERANQAKSEFLSRMSHELRTPLNAILGFAQLLELEDLPADQRESVQHIDKAGRHLLSLINEVLEIARIEAGKLALTLEPIEVEGALQDVVGLVRPLAAERNVELQAQPSQPGPLHVTADGQRLKQVMLNLLSNAIKYNRPGGKVSLNWEQTGAHLVRITVSDTGRGIPPEEMDRLFEPFERLGADQSGVEGTGLGLALSKRLLDGMGGTLRGESTLGDGSTFSLELPPARPPAHAGAGETAGAQQEAGPGWDGRTATVLYIEDNALNRKLVANLLVKRPGVRLLEAMQGSMGLDLAQQHHPDLILLDLNLPDMAGTDVLRRLRERPATWEIPVAVVSADATKAQMRKLKGAGAHAYLTKPIDVRALLAVVDEALAT